MSDDLAALARAATPGPWTRYHLPRTNTTEVQAEGERPIVQWMGFDDSSRTRAQHGRNAAYIAAMSPDVTLALLDRLDHAEQRTRDLEGLLGATTDELRALVHDGWSAFAQKRALDWAETADREARAAIEEPEAPEGDEVTYCHKPTQAELRRTLVGDSIDRREALTKLLQMVREEERAKVMDTLARTKANAEQGR